MKPRDIINTGDVLTVSTA